MLYNFQRKKLCRHLLAGGVLCAVGFGLYACSDTYDLDSEQPSGLNSIYGYLESQGKYTNYLKLIDDLGQKEVLSKTDSKTMFVADDDAFARFYASNKWGVRSYSELSNAQKTLLLKSSSIDNPYSTSMLSTATGPTRGEVCRRQSSVELLDSVLVVPKGDPQGVLPKNDRFAEVMANHDEIVLFTDASASAPMIHFTAKFLSSNQMESSDLDFLYNQPAGTRASDEVYVNNAKIVEPNIFCKNGFIHKVDQVVLPLDNMANVIHNNPNTKIYNSILDRFAALQYDATLTESYNGTYHTNYDSIFVKRYYSLRSAGSNGTANVVAFNVDKNGNNYEEYLKFDPGWNTYNPAVYSDRDGMMEDMAVMLVPTDDALTTWWNDEEGGGKPLREKYGTIENTPSSVLIDLLDVNMLVTMTASVPSRFDDVLDDALEPLGITEAAVDSVCHACNGMVYQLNKVFTPALYNSVYLPAKIDPDVFNIISTAIDQLNYDTYLKSMVADYIFLLPTNEGFLSYIDPVSFGLNKTRLWEFHYDPTAAGTSSDPNLNRIYARIYEVERNAETGEWQKVGDTYTEYHASVNSTSTNPMVNRLQRILDETIAVEGYQPGKKYYRTKGNTYVRVDGINTGDHVYGSMQESGATQSPLAVSTSYEYRNGRTLVLDGIAGGTDMSVAKTLAAHEEFSEFLRLLNAAGALYKENNLTGYKWRAGDQEYGNVFNSKSAGTHGAEITKQLKKGSNKATFLFNNYHYTLYAPTNAAMAEAYRQGLPTPEELAEAEERDKENGYDAAKDTLNEAGRLKEAMLDFIKYHIHDNSVYVDKGFAAGDYETSKVKYEPAYESDDEGNIYATGKYAVGRPYTLRVTPSASGITIVDNMGATHEVDMADGLYNLTAREYWFKSTMGTASAVPQATANAYAMFLNNTSSVVIHGINTPLLYDAPAQFKYVYKPTE